MPYCRKCGAKLEDDARFCYRCGTPVAELQPETAPARTARPAGRNPLIIPVIILVAIVLTAVIVTAIVFAPVNPVNFNQTNEVTQPNINRLNLNFEADIAEITIFAENLTGKTIQLTVSAQGSTSVFGSPNPVQVAFNNQTAGNELTVTSKVTINNDIFSENIKVTCYIFIDPSLNISLKVKSNVGQIIFNADAPATIESLNLEATTGLVQASMENGTLLAGEVSLKTTTGEVHFRMDKANVLGNVTVNLQSTTGLVDTNITETQELSGNVQVNAITTTGSVNLNVLIDNGVGARIESQTNIGGITTDLQGFSGDKSPIQSNNYPAESNFLINMRTNTGGIHIRAVYQSSVTPAVRN